MGLARRFAATRNQLELVSQFSPRSKKHPFFACDSIMVGVPWAKPKLLFKGLQKLPLGRIDKIIIGDRYLTLDPGVAFVGRPQVARAAYTQSVFLPRPDLTRRTVT
jgi:hypothetical protein